MTTGNELYELYHPVGMNRAKLRYATADDNTRRVIAGAASGPWGVGTAVFSFSGVPLRSGSMVLTFRFVAYGCMGARQGRTAARSGQTDESERERRLVLLIEREQNEKEACVKYFWDFRQN